jgi:hypothetical protein
LTACFKRYKPLLKVLDTSGYSQDVLDSDLNQGGKVNFLSKPYEPHKLVQTVRLCLDGTDG